VGRKIWYVLREGEYQSHNSWARYPPPQATVPSAMKPRTSIVQPTIVFLCIFVTSSLHSIRWEIRFNPFPVSQAESNVWQASAPVYPARLVRLVRTRETSPKKLGHG
jgi:hypothetical protein